MKGSTYSRHRWSRGWDTRRYNQSWSVDESLDFLLEIEKRGVNIEYLEQPIAAENKAGLAQIRQSDTKIMADEALYTLQI